MNDPIRTQYERFPYPPVPSFALPRKGQGRALSYELGTQLVHGAPTAHRGIRVLVAGAGTLEALVVAQTHPEAAEVVALDVSEASLDVLARRVKLSRLLRPKEKLAPLKLVHGDLLAWLNSHSQGNEQFDFIVASNVLHHLADPSAALETLARHLKPQGVLRIVTYPKASRVWMRETSKWLRANQILPGKLGAALQARWKIAELPSTHPVRSCFESQPETWTQAGLVDAFLNARENPLSPLEWKSAAHAAGLELAGETHRETSRSDFLDELVPAAKRKLDPWEKLQVLDDVLEVCANPILWFRKTVPNLSRSFDRISVESVEIDSLPQEGEFHLIPSRVRWEIGQGLRRAETLLGSAGVPLAELVDRLRVMVGPRVRANSGALHGLSILDLDFASVMQLPKPWNADEWNARVRGSRLYYAGEFGPPVTSQGRTIAEQVEWLQLRFGAMMDWIPVWIV